MYRVHAIVVGKPSSASSVSRQTWWAHTMSHPTHPTMWTHPTSNPSHEGHPNPSHARQKTSLVLTCWPWCPSSPISLFWYRDRRWLVLRQWHWQDCGYIVSRKYLDLSLTHGEGFRVDFIDGSVRVTVFLKSMIRVIGAYWCLKVSCSRKPELSDWLWHRLRKQVKCGTVCVSINSKGKELRSGLIKSLIAKQ